MTNNPEHPENSINPVGSGKKGKALVALSGGVDSAVAALTMRDAGYECMAVMLRMFDTNGDFTKAEGDARAKTVHYEIPKAVTDVCSETVHLNISHAVTDARTETAHLNMPQAVNDACAETVHLNMPQTVTDACAVSAYLGIPITIVDARELFRRTVIAPFVRSYLVGDTPNPCVLCNSGVKFAALADYALQNGFNRIATGHYARVAYDAPSGRFLLSKGADSAKDQSYMLYALTQRQLALAEFPLGGMRKGAVRQIAESRGLPNADKPDSQDICFIPGGGYAEFIEAQTGEKQPEGSIFDENGAVVGSHAGALRYTIGQRKGLGVAAGGRVYVYAKSMADNAVFAGPEPLLFSKSLIADNINLIPLKSLDKTMRVTAKTRYRQGEQPATIEQLSDDTIRVAFDNPQRAVACGQSVVFYDGETVVGGGIIKNVIS